ncbi:MAG: class I SAM-dependent methyltransferase [Leptothrix sp. (in: b-proteobacteria)]
MITPTEPRVDGYESFYREFDSPLMHQLRREAYGEDIGQHSWVSATELRGDIQRLGLSPASRLLDLGCGPCGPLTFMIKATGCHGTGIELSPSALQVGRTRAITLGIESLFFTQEADLNDPLPFGAESFDAVASLDVVLHLRDRARLFHDVARLLPAGGRFLLTDAGVITGPISNEEVRKRSVHGYTQFVTPGWNEQLLAAAGFRLVESEDRTASVLRNASGRLAAMNAHRPELEQLSGASAVTRQQDYLETLVDLSKRHVVSRFMYLAEVNKPGGF